MVTIRMLKRLLENLNGLWHSSVVVAITAALLASSTAFAAFPDRPLRLIVPFPAGNPLDVRARQLSNHLPKILGQQVVVDNRGGASEIGRAHV